MKEQLKKIHYLFFTTGFLIFLGLQENRQLEVYTLTYDNLILKQDTEEGAQAIAEALEALKPEHKEPPVEVANEGAEADPTPAQANVTEPGREAQANGREPAAVAWRDFRLNGKRKVRTLFAASDIRATIDFENEPQILRRREVGIDGEGLVAMLGDLPTNRADLMNVSENERSFDLNLFADSEFKAVIDLVKSSAHTGYVVRGHLDGIEASSFTLVQENGITVANINTDRAIFEVRYAGNTHIVNHVDPTKFASDEPQTAEQQSLIESGDVAADVIGSTATPNPALSDTAASAGGSTVIDLLVAYTPALRAAQGGAAVVEALIQLGVDQANQAYLNSQINQRLRLVATLELESNESTSAVADLTALRSTSDGKWDGIHAARAAVAADVVHVLTQNFENGLCGIGFLNATKASAFSISRASCLSNYSLTHEIAHNMGAQHDRAHASSSNANSYGYIDLAHGFRTIMSYPVGGTVRVNYFSNPRVSYKGYPTGDPAEDNASALNANRARIAAFNNPSAPINNLAAAAVPTSASDSMAAADTAGGCSIQLISPNGGEILQIDQPQPVMWSAKNAGRQVKIKLIRGETDLGELERSGADGMASVRIPDLVEPGADYRISVESVDSPGCYGVSDRAIVIAPRGK